jgi:predicted transposase YbfD/YdcC
VREKERGDGPANNRLPEVPWDSFQALLNSQPGTTHPPLAVWRSYNGRANCKNVVREQREGRKDEEVGLVTDLEPEDLSASQWLKSNRDGWDIENGGHQRLDVTLNDDCCRVRSGNGLLILGLFRRLNVSLFIHWRLQQPKPHQKSLTDFQSLMGENNLANALSFVTCQRPRLP